MFTLVDGYFHHFNKFLPIFQHDHIRELLIRPSQLYDPLEVAIMKVVLALGQVVVNGAKLEASVEYEETVISMLPDLMFRRQDLLGLQIILGLVVLFQGTPRSAQHKKIPMLMGAAARLVQDMGLHRRKDTSDLSYDEILQRSRLYWITYILDRV